METRLHIALMAVAASGLPFDRPSVASRKGPWQPYQGKSSKGRYGSKKELEHYSPEKRAKNKARRQAIKLQRAIARS